MSIEHYLVFNFDTSLHFVALIVLLLSFSCLSLLISFYCFSDYLIRFESSYL